MWYFRFVRTLPSPVFVCTYCLVNQTSVSPLICWSVVLYPPKRKASRRVQQLTAVAGWWLGYTENRKNTLYYWGLWGHTTEHTKRTADRPTDRLADWQTTTAVYLHWGAQRFVDLAARRYSKTSEPIRTWTAYSNFSTRAHINEYSITSCKHTGTHTHTQHPLTPILGEIYTPKIEVLR